MNKFPSDSPARLRIRLGSLHTIIQSGKLERFFQLLTDFKFIEAKINHPEFGVQALIEDYDLINNARLLNFIEYDVESVKCLKLIQGALQLSAHILMEDKAQLSTQLWGRLQDYQILDIQILLNQAKQNQNIWLRPCTASLTRPNGRLLRTLSNHRDWVNTVTITSNNKYLISGSSDHTIKVWDLATGIEINTLNGHKDSVNAVVTTSDCQKIISASSDLTIKVWDLATGTEINTLSGHTAPVVTLAVTPDGKQLISGSIDKTVKIWELETGKQILTQAKHNNWVRAVAITPNGEQFISGADAGCLIGWDLKSGKECYRCFNPKREGSSDQREEVCSLIISPNNEWIISGSSKGNIRFWSLKTKNIVLTLDSHQTPVTALSITSDNNKLISAYLDATIKIWDLKQIFAYLENQNRTGDVWNLTLGKEIFTLSGHFDSVYSISTSSDSKYLVSASKDSTIKIWDLQTNEENIDFTDEYRSPISSLAITHDDTKIISVSKTGKLTQFDLNTPNMIIGEICANNITSNENLILILGIFIFFIAYFIFIQISKELCSTNDISKTICSLLPYVYYPLVTLYGIYLFIRYCLKIIISLFKVFIDNTPRYLIYFQRGVFNVFNCKTILWDKYKLINIVSNNVITLINNKTVVSVDGSIVIVSTDTFQRLALLTKGIVQKRNLFSQIKSYWDFAGLIGSVLWLLKNTKIDYQFLGLNYIIAHLLYDKVKNIDFTTAIAITPDSKYLLSSSYNNFIQIWDIERKKRIAILKNHNNLVKSLAVSNDGKYFASASNDKKIRVWNLKKRKLIFTLKGHTDSVNTVVITDDNKYLISGSNDKKINIWDLERRKVSFTFSGHLDSINALKFIPYNNQVISVSSDKTLQIWDMQTGQVIAKFTGESSINCCSVSSDGLTIVAGEESGRLHILHLEGRNA